MNEDGWRKVAGPETSQTAGDDAITEWTTYYVGPTEYIGGELLRWESDHTVYTVGVDPDDNGEPTRWAWEEITYTYTKVWHPVDGWETGDVLNDEYNHDGGSYISYETEDAAATSALAYAGTDWSFAYAGLGTFAGEGVETPDDAATVAGIVVAWLVRCSRPLCGIYTLFPREVMA